MALSEIQVSSIVMDFLVYSRSAPVAEDSEDDPDLDEQHWSYMDGFAGGMAARGPTLGTDRQTWTGSLHVVDLSGPKAAREFVTSDPYNQAGLFEEHFIWRFANLLGRTMWQFAGAADEPRFLVLAQASEDRSKVPGPVPAAELAPQLRERLIVYGALRDLVDEEVAGVALAVQVPTREALDPLLGDGLAGFADYGDVGIHDWEFGGRR
ncbi:MAG: YciI family protein [Candidatus Dormibacteria bacterium]